MWATSPILAGERAGSNYRLGKLKFISPVRQQID
jgi:hypothetical protein